MPLSPNLPAQPGPDDPIFEDRSKPFLIRVLVVVLVVALVVLVLRPALRAIRSRQAPGSAEQAIALILQKRPFAEIEGIVRQAIAKAPGHSELLRTAAAWATAEGRPEGLTWGRQLLGTTEVSREDRQRFVESALTANRLDMSGPELAALFKFDPSDPETLRLLVRHHELNDDLTGATTVARHAVARHPADDDLRTLLGQLLLRSTSDAARAEGRSVLQAIAAREGPFRDAAVNTLAENTELNDAERQTVIKAINARSGGGIIDRLRVATLRMRADPAYRNQAIADAITAAGPNPAATNLIALGTWLHELGEPSRILEVIPFPKAQLDAALLSLHLGAVAALDRWAEIEPRLQATSENLDPAYNHLLLAAVAFRQGRRNDAEQAFDLAIQASGTDTAKLQLIARQAEAFGLITAATRAQERRAGVPGYSGTASREIIRLIGISTDTKFALDTLERISRTLSSSLAIATEAAYLRVLRNDGLAEARLHLALLAAQNPSNREIRLVQAFGELQAQNAVGARSILEAEPYSWQVAPARWQVVHAAILGANGDAEAARQWAGRIDTGRLKREEIELIRPWLK